MSTRIALDLTKYAFRRQHGDITVYGTWFGDRQRPVLVLVPTHRLSFDKTTPCVIPLENAWKWSEEAGDPRDAVQTAFKFAELLGLDGFNRFTVMRILSIVRDELGELLKIPPKPTESQVVADAFRTDVNGKVTHTEIREHV